MTDISELNALRARIDQLEAQAAKDDAERAEQRTSRRGMLRLAGAAAVGGLAAAVTADPVAAADPNDVVLNLSTNPGTTPTGISMAASAQAYGLGCYESGLGALNAGLGRPAVFGHATGTAFTNGVAGHSTTEGGSGVFGLDTNPTSFGAGVYGKSTNGSGVYGYSPSGQGVFAGGGSGALFLYPVAPAAPPSRATAYSVNTVDTDSAGNVWFCYESGTPGKWRKIAGPSTAGAFHAISPTRVYDSRAAAPTPGVLASGNNRLVSVADGRDGVGTVTTANLVPAGATAVAANITITNTTGVSGFLAVNPGGVTVVTASTINWFGPGQKLANGVTLTLNSTREVSVICGGSSCSSHFIIDIAGYYL